MDYAGAELGCVASLLGETNDSGLGGLAAKQTELFVRTIRSQVSVDANGVWHGIGLDSTVPITFSNTVLFDGLAAFNANSQGNTINFVADTLEISSLARHYANTTFLNFAKLVFAPANGVSDVYVGRTAPATMGVVSAAGGGWGVNTDGENFARLFMLNDAGGVAFGNGSNIFDTVISRYSPNVLAIGTGYGDATGTLRLEGLIGNTGTIGHVLATTVNATSVNSATVLATTSLKAPNTTTQLVNFYDSGLGNIDVRIARTSTAQVTLIAAAGGNFGMSTDGDAFSRLFMLNDTGGIGFGNGTNFADAFISRYDPSVAGHLCIGTGYGDASGSLRANAAIVNHLRLADANTTANIGGAALTAGQSNTDTVIIAGCAVGHVVVVTPKVYPGNGFNWKGYISNTNVVTVVLDCAVAGTPTSTKFDVRVIQ